MPAERFFLSEAFTDKKILTITGKEQHHLTVMRLRKGETLEIINGKGELALATLEELSKDRATVRIQEIHRSIPLDPPLTIIQGLPKQNHLEFLIEKGTELGASSFWLFPADRSEKKSLTPHALNRLETIAIAAIKQCGSLYLPEIKIVPSLDLLPLPPGHLFFGDTRPSAPHFSTLLAKDQPLTFFIGPEKGWSEKEIHLLEKQQHAKGVRLHPHILRTETVAPTVCALFRCF